MSDSAEHGARIPHERDFLQLAIRGEKPIDVWFGRCTDCSHEWAVWLEVGQDPGWSDCPSCNSENALFEFREENKILPTPSQAANRVSGQ